MTQLKHLIVDGPTLSFEFFPPRTDTARRGLEKALAELAELVPRFVSVTYGAGGSAIDVTRDVVVEISTTYDFPAMPHLTAVGHTRADIAELLTDYTEQGIDNILVLAGDPPADGSKPGGDFSYASELLDVVAEHGDFSIAVAAFPEMHPRSPDRPTDRRHLAAKLARADVGITQFFFDADPYFRMLDELDGLGNTTPVLPGILPVLNPVSARRFATMNGAAIPEDFFGRLEAADEANRYTLAVEQATQLGERLLAGGAPGIHFYSLNRADAVAEVARNLGLAGSH